MQLHPKSIQLYPLYNEVKQEAIHSVHDRYTLYLALKAIVGQTNYRFLNHLMPYLDKTSNSSIRETIYTAKKARVISLLSTISPLINLSAKEVQTMCSQIRWKFKGVTNKAEKANFLPKSLKKKIRKEHHYINLNLRKHRYHHYHVPNQYDIKEHARRVHDRTSYWEFFRYVLKAYEITLNHASRTLKQKNNNLRTIILRFPVSDIVNIMRTLALNMSIPYEVLVDPLERKSFSEPSHKYKSERKMLVNKLKRLRKKLSIAEADKVRQIAKRSEALKTEQEQLTDRLYRTQNKIAKYQQLYKAQKALDGAVAVSYNVDNQTYIQLPKAFYVKDHRKYIVQMGEHGSIVLKPYNHVD